MKILGVLLGILNILLGLFCFLLILITQLMLILYVFLASLYFFCGAGFLTQQKWARKLFLWGVVPSAAIATFNVIAIGYVKEPAYFQTPLETQIIIVGITVFLPFVLNMIYLLNPKVKQSFH